MVQPPKEKPPLYKKKIKKKIPVLDSHWDSSKVKEISVSYGRTYNLGDFNSMKLQIGVTLDITEGEDYLKVMAKEIEALKSFSRGQCKQIIGEEQK